MLCKHLNNCDTCQLEVIDECKVKYSNIEPIYFSLENTCINCGCYCHTINNYDYYHCTNCGHTWR